MLTLLKTKNEKTPSLTFEDSISNANIQIAQIFERVTEPPCSAANRPSTEPAPAPAPTLSLRVQTPSPTFRHKPTTDLAPTPGTKLTPNSAPTPTPAPESRV